MTEDDIEEIRQIIKTTVIYGGSCDGLTVDQAKSLMISLETRILVVLDRFRKDT